MHPDNKKKILELDGAEVLRRLGRTVDSDKVRQQVNRALANLGVDA